MAAETKAPAGAPAPSLDSLFMGFLVLEFENSQPKIDYIKQTLVPNLSKTGACVFVSAVLRLAAATTLACAT